jgi:hypothetical protein
VHLFTMTVSSPRMDCSGLFPSDFPANILYAFFFSPLRIGIVWSVIQINLILIYLVLAHLMGDCVVLQCINEFRQQLSLLYVYERAAGRFCNVCCRVMSAKITVHVTGSV